MYTCAYQWLRFTPWRSREAAVGHCVCVTPAPSRGPRTRVPAPGGGSARTPCRGLARARRCGRARESAHAIDLGIPRAFGPRSYLRRRLGEEVAPKSRSVAASAVGGLAIQAEVGHPEVVAGPGPVDRGAVKDGEPVEKALLELALLLPVDRQVEVGVHGVLLHIKRAVAGSHGRPLGRVAPRTVGGTVVPIHLTSVPPCGPGTHGGAAVQRVESARGCAPRRPPAVRPIASRDGDRNVKPWAMARH